jgi:hypothetical protein
MHRLTLCFIGAIAAGAFVAGGGVRGFLTELMSQMLNGV